MTVEDSWKVVRCHVSFWIGMVQHDHPAMLLWGVKSLAKCFPFTRPSTASPFSHRWPGVSCVVSFGRDSVAGKDWCQSMIYFLEKWHSKENLLSREPAWWVGWSWWSNCQQMTNLSTVSETTATRTYALTPADPELDDLVKWSTRNGLPWGTGVLDGSGGMRHFVKRWSDQVLRLPVVCCGESIIQWYLGKVMVEQELQLLGCLLPPMHGCSCASIFINHMKKLENSTNSMAWWNSSGTKQSKCSRLVKVETLNKVLWWYLCMNCCRQK